MKLVFIEVHSIIYVCCNLIMNTLSKQSIYNFGITIPIKVCMSLSFVIFFMSHLLVNIWTNFPAVFSYPIISRLSFLPLAFVKFLIRIKKITLSNSCLKIISSHVFTFANIKSFDIQFRKLIEQIVIECIFSSSWFIIQNLIILNTFAV